MSPSILVVDDEPGIIEIASAYLRRDGFTVRTATSGGRAMDAVATQPPDLVILDLMLPDVSGEEVCASLRRSSSVPILMLTAKSAEEHRLRGLALGADDYLVKPFSPRELVARVRAILRRTSGTAAPPADLLVLDDGRLEVDLAAHAARFDGRPMALTATEFRLLSALCRHPRRAFSRFELLQVLQGPDVEGFERTVDVHVMRLRRSSPTRAHPTTSPRSMASATGSTNPTESPGGLGLRARLVAGFVGIAALATLVATVLTSVGLHGRFDAYLQQRTDDAARSAIATAETTYAGAGTWSEDAVDILAHELVLTGYDFRLIDRGRTLLDTTKLDRPGLDFRRVAALPVHAPAGAQVGVLELYALGPEGSMPADDQLRADLDRAHLVAAGVAAIVAIVAGLIVAGRLSRPLRRLAATARGLATGGPPPGPAAGSREVRELSAALGHLADDLARQQRSRRQLAQDLSHELRTPLMLLQSRIEAMQDGVVPFDAEGLAALHTETLRLTRLVSQIELLAESEASPPPLRDEVVMLDEVAREVHAALAAAFEVRGLTLQVHVRPAAARGDHDAVRQIAMNLLSNALKYAPDGSRVQVATTSDGDRSRLSVRDEGDGLPAGAGERVFERFYRGRDAVANSGGVGLGLTIARNLAEAQDGTLTVAAEATGTCFVLSLPSARDAAPGDGGGADAARPPRRLGALDR